MVLETDIASYGKIKQGTIFQEQIEEDNDATTHCNYFTCQNIYE